MFLSDLGGPGGPPSSRKSLSVFEEVATPLVVAPLAFSGEGGGRRREGFLIPPSLRYACAPPAPPSGSRRPRAGARARLGIPPTPGVRKGKRKKERRKEEERGKGDVGTARAAVRRWELHPRTAAPPRSVAVPPQGGTEPSAGADAAPTPPLSGLSGRSLLTELVVVLCVPVEVHDVHVLLRRLVQGPVGLLRLLQRRNDGFQLDPPPPAWPAPPARASTSGEGFQLEPPPQES